MKIVIKSLNEEYYKTLSYNYYLQSIEFLNKPIDLYKFDKLHTSNDVVYVDLITFYNGAVIEHRCYYDTYIIINKETHPEYYL